MNTPTTSFASFASRRNVSAIVALWVLVASGCVRATNSLTLLVYNSCLAPEGLCPKLQTRFEERTAQKLRFVAVSDVPQMIARAEVELKYGAPRIHAVLGIDEIARRQLGEMLEPSAALENQCVNVLSDLGCGAHFLPFDYGVQSWMARSKEPVAPLSLRKPLFGLPPNARVSMPDPRSSFVGLGLLWLTESVHLPIASWRSSWVELSRVTRLKAPSWEYSYAAFVKGEVDWTWSYTTSEAYHRFRGEEGYRAVIYEEGNPIQAEGLAFLRGPIPATVRDARDRLAAILLSEDFQHELGTLNWMYPARKGVTLPGSFQGLPEPKKRLRFVADPASVKESLAQWRKQIISTY